MEAKQTILIVEDNQILRIGLQEMISYEGFSVLTAGNGQEALDHMADLTPDLILSDISMPVMDGFSFFKLVRSKPEWVTIPFIFLTARGDREDIMLGKDLGAEDYLIKPLTREELLTAVRARLARSHQLHMVQLSQAYEASLTMLANAIEARNEYTRGHVERVTAYAVLLGEYAGLQGKRLESLRLGAILHDIGKILVRESTLIKKSSLNAEEWDEMRQHPLLGSQMIKQIPYLAAAVPIIRHHHEYWDGTGYPDMLQGEDIPLEARIVSVADGFDAMTTTRPYRFALSLTQAYNEIAACSGTQFDPNIVALFQKAWGDHRIHQIAANRDLGRMG